MDEKERLLAENKKGKHGCLIWAVVLIISPVMIFGGIFYYDMNLKERSLKVSTSSSGNHTIEIVEKGSAFFFGPSKVRIKFNNEKMDRTIHNDGAALTTSNAFISWVHENQAVVTLFGDEQEPEHIEINFSKKKGEFEIIDDGQPAFKPITVEMSESPKGENKIEIREMVALPDEGHGFHSIRVYYGDGNEESELKKYEEYVPVENQITYVDEYKVTWLNEEQASIDIMLKNQDFEFFIYDTISVDLNQ
ncbi:hypothetical protein [Cytobacillus gottheilii]|uniref:hypothetical protein n=1 Tax=Cytobacillus gottheilii TaxID=859144 RepID=UPI0009BB0AAB|nr:hypothetical protein [Cytobacillus gottheilii]